MFKQLVNSARKVVNHCSIATVVCLSTASTAFAEGGLPAVDVTEATGVITNQGGAAIGAVGQALIGLAGIALVYRWVKATFF